MPDDRPVLVQGKNTGEYGIHHPEKDIIEIYDGDGRAELDTDALTGENWHEADAEDLRASTEADIDEVREEIEEIRGREISDEQTRVLEQAESRLESYERRVDLVREVHDEPDN